MRIALSHPWCWPDVQRGGERLFADLSDYLARAGHDVLTVSASRRPGHCTTPSGAQKVVVRGSELRVPLLGRLDQSVTYLPMAARAVRRFGPDVFHGLFHLDGVLGRMARCPRRVVHVQGMPRREALAGRPLERHILSLSMVAPTVIAAVSQASADVIESEFGYQARVLHNGINTLPFNQAELRVERGPEPSVLFPSSPTDGRKRLGLLIEAMNRLSPRWSGLRLVVAAPTPQELRQRVEDESFVPVDWLSTTHPDDMPAAYARAWVACAPAVREAFGLVYVEALATGRPAVGLRDGGVPEVVPEPRWLASPDDAESLVEALDSALEDAQRPDTAARCRDHAATFDWSERGPAFEALYSELADSIARP